MTSSSSFKPDERPHLAGEVDAYQITQRINGPAAPKREQPKVPEATTADLSFLTPSERPETLGRLDHYLVIEVRGRGGFGVVLKAFDEKLHRIVALKVLAPQLAACPLARKRFLREAQAAAAIRNDHVIGIFAVEDGPWPYIAMEYVDGPSLEEKIERDGPLPLTEILRIGQQTASGLAAAHQQGLVHRDIKPGNILLENGVARVKITDFGLARAIDDASLSQAGVVSGTPAYMAPEQADGAPLDHRADLFSLGSVLYTMATGKLPFHGLGSVAMLRSVVDKKSRPVREERPDAPAWLESIIAKLHAKNPDRRYQSAREVATLLAQHLAALQEHGAAHVTAGARVRRVLAWLLTGLVCISLALALRHASTPAPATDPPLAVAPHDAAQARLHQERWAQRLKTPLELVNTLDQKLVLVPPGEFIMGGDDGAARRAQPLHPVRITQPFYCGTHEVTVAEFRAFAEATGFQTHAEKDPLGGKIWRSDKRSTEQRPDINWRTPGFPQSDRHPACCITWDDAEAFCRWLTQKEGRPYRLPTEAEWEYACRAGTTTPYHYGPAAVPERMSANVRSTLPVGSFPANAFGLCDMHGNVYEWCLDGQRVYEPAAATDPRGPLDEPRRVMRGGGYSSGASWAVTSHGRSTAALDHAYAAIGFRVVLDCRR
jgi:formylglycine-generating enzyme required for sulfatase activity/tRNA A-37 threonylcarbamoyl transferase component Bud32